MSERCQERSFKEVESELACRALSPVSASEVIDDDPLATHLAMPIAERQQCTAILASPTPPQSLAPRSWNDHDQVLVDLTLWQGGQGMRIMTVAFALGTALCNLRTFSVAADAREPRVRLIVRVPVESPTGILTLFHDIVIALRTTGSIHAAGP